MVSKIKNIVLGAGQVANAIKNNLLTAPLVFDRGEWEKTHLKSEILHVTIPYSDDFERIIIKAIYNFDPEIIIIHSTVKPGTTEKLGKNVLFSPVLGRHSDEFSNNIQMYQKFFAGDPDCYEQVRHEFQLNSEFWGTNTGELEYSKIMSTTRMYWELLFTKSLEKDCKKNGYDFKQVHHRWTDNYNAGIRLKHPKWERTIYSMMDSDLPGGHCLRPNIHLVDNEITNYIKAYEKEILYIVSKG